MTTDRAGVATGLAAGVAAGVAGCITDRKLGAFFGGVVGDAYGSQYEFLPRDSYRVSPDMGRNVFGLPPGSFTDDSSMMLCLAASLGVKKAFDPSDQMERYVRWWRDGYMSSSDERRCFDIGRTTSIALQKFYNQTKDSGGTPRSPYVGSEDHWESGNGGIMRLAPIPIYYSDNADQAREYAILSSKVTHASPECLDAAALMSDVMVHLLNGGQKHSMPHTEGRYATPAVKAIASLKFLSKDRGEVKTTGYVIHTLEAALWAFHKSKTFEEGMMVLVGMGGDVDTVCCVYGQIAGAFYGYSGIPERWVKSLRKQHMLWQVARVLTNF